MSVYTCAARRLVRRSAQPLGLAFKYTCHARQVRIAHVPPRRTLVRRLSRSGLAHRPCAAPAVKVGGYIISLRATARSHAASLNNRLGLQAQLGCTCHIYGRWDFLGITMRAHAPSRSQPGLASQAGLGCTCHIT